MSKLAFLGSPDVAAEVLVDLVDAGHEIALVVSAPDRRRGRGGALAPTPVKAVALERGLAVATSPDEVLAVGVELAVVVAYGRLLRAPLIDVVPHVNVHFSLLPRWRGAAPVERAILAGDARTGVCLMRIDAGLDTGPVYACRQLEIEPHETAAELRRRLGRLGSALLLERLVGGLATLGQPVDQQGTATYAAKVDPAELHIDWSQPAEEIERLVRIGRAWTTWRGRRLLVERAVAEPGDGGEPGLLVDGAVSTGDGRLRLLVVRPEGRGALAAPAWWRGARLQPGERVGG